MTTKTITPFFYGEVSEEGKLLIEQPEDWLKYIALNFAGKRVKLAISGAFKNRSYRQNNYYWGVIIPCAAEAMALHPDEAHSLLGDMFLRAEITDKKGTRHEIVRSTSALTTQEAEDYYAKSREFLSAEFEYYVPLPNEADWTGSEGLIKERHGG